MAKVTYKSSGVDLDVYQESMQRIARLVTRTYSPRVRRLDGGFAGLFQLDFANKLFARNYRKPTLVACTDGVGTKLKVAMAAGRHETIGIDLVAMCVNDAVCCGAEPLFFLDYVAMSHDDPSRLEQIVSGITAGCVEADCALLGGETAIMPDMYQGDEYDVAGFCVGVVEDDRVIDGSAVTPGDVLIGLAASGLHSNGFSLFRKIVFEIAGHNPRDFIPELGQTVADALLVPTRIYVQPVRRVLSHYKVKNVVHGIAHITGGGLFENLSRILPGHTRAVINRQSWETPAIFRWLQQLGEVDEAEMERVTNMGIGLVMVVSEYYAESISQQLTESGYENCIIGEMIARPASATQLKGTGHGDVVWSHAAAGAAAGA